MLSSNSKTSCSQASGSAVARDELEASPTNKTSSTKKCFVEAPRSRLTLFMVRTLLVPSRITHYTTARVQLRIGEFIT